MDHLKSLLSKALAQRNQNSQLRQRLTLHSRQLNGVQIGDRSYIDFSSNDYLGLASHTDSLRAIKQQLDQSGFGAGASHLICGHHKIHQQLELTLSEFLQRDAALTFSTGYMANLSILQSLAKKGDLIIADKLNHASLIDGSRLSAAESTRYLHCDLAQLESRLKKTAINKWVVTDSVFSMDGNLAPLKEMAALCQHYQAHLIVDDAHGIGVLGDHGRGCIEQFNLSQTDLPILMGTFGKAFGGFGAFVSGDQTLIDYLIQFARPYIYTTALPACVAAGNLKNLTLLKNNPALRTQLIEKIKYFKQQCQIHHIPLMGSQTAIQPIKIANTKKMLTIANKLKQKGLLVGAIRPPTVAKDSDRLRISISASHSIEQIDFLVAQLATMMETMINKHETTLS